MPKTDQGLVLFPDHGLTQVCKPVATFDDEFRTTAQRMLKQVVEFRGYALAAPQVGIHRRFFVTTDSPDLEPTAPVMKDGKLYPYPRIVCNPEIIDPTGEVLYKESCLSLPGIVGANRRIASFWLRFQDEFGRKIEYPANGVFAIMCQHEIDHLDGILFIDRISPYERRRLDRAINKFRRKQ